MVKLLFEVHGNYLISHMLGSDYSDEDRREDITALQNKARQISPAGCDALSGMPFPEGWRRSPRDEVAREAQKLLRILKKTEEYGRVLQQTQDYREWLEDQWTYNHSKTLAIMQETTGLSLDDEFIVYLTHPSLRNGRYLGNKRIAWGHSEDWLNYSIVYLWHEMLHDKLPSDDAGHGVIELTTDEELRVRLNGGHYPPFVGHKYLSTLKERMLPSWKRYLASQRRDILEFYREMS